MEEGTSKGDNLFEPEEVVCKEDSYIRKAEEQDWRSRSSFKLLQIDEKFDIFKGVKRVVDLYASPGIWTQVLSRRLYKGEKVYINDKCCLFYNELALHQRLEAQEEPEYKNPDKEVVIVAVDAYGIPPYPGVVQIDGDFAQYSTAQLILRHLDGKKADLIVCNKLVNHTGLHSVDINFQANHVVLVLHMTCNILKKGGTLVVAIFKETDNDLLMMQLSSIFKEVEFFRPKCSKISAKEIFAICRQYSPPEGFDPRLMMPYLDFCNKDFSPLTGINRIVIPFLVCGDLSAYPLSAEDAELYKNAFPLPFSMEKSCSSTNKMTFALPFSMSEATASKEELEHYLDKMNEAIKNVALQTDPDFKEVETVKRRSGVASSSSEVKREDESKDEANKEEESIIDEGPLFDLIQRTTKIKKYPRESEPETASTESGLQFLYEDESTDPEAIRQCLECVRISMLSSTCTCDHIP